MSNTVRHFVSANKTNRLSLSEADMGAFSIDKICYQYQKGNKKPEGVGSLKNELPASGDQKGQCAQTSSTSFAALTAMPSTQLATCKGSRLGLG